MKIIKVQADVGDVAYAINTYQDVKIAYPISIHRVVVCGITINKDDIKYYVRDCDFQESESTEWGVPVKVYSTLRQAVREFERLLKTMNKHEL